MTDQDERNLPPHDADGWASTTTKHDFLCPRCASRVLPGQTVVASGYGPESPIRWICHRHSNIAAERHG